MWFKKLATNNIQEILLGVILGNTDINLAIQQIRNIGPSCCDEINAIAIAHPQSSGKLFLLNNAAGCSEKQSEISDNLNQPENLNQSI